MSQKCKASLRQEFGGPNGILGDKAIDSLVDRLSKFKESHIASGGTEGSFKKIAIQLIEKDRRELKANHIEAKTNLLKKKNRYSEYAGFKGELSGKKAGRAMADAVLSKLSGGQRLKKGANNSAFRYQKTRMIEYKSNLYHSMQKTGVFEAFQKADGEMQTDIAREIWARGEGKKGMVTNNPVAYEIGNILHAHNQKMLSDLRAAGLQIGEIPTYIIPQTHSRAKVMELGKEAWIEKIAPELDEVKTFGTDAGNPEKIKEFLDAAYDNIVNGRFEQINDIVQASDELITVSKYGKLGSKVSRSRSLHFKDADSFMRYNLELGENDLFTGVVRNTESTAKAQGLIEVFGTNPDAAVEADIKNIERALGDDAEALAAFKGEQDHIRNTFKNVRGTSNIPANEMAAKIWGGVRSVTSMAKLGMAGVRGLTDLANAAAVLSATTGKPFLSAQLDVATEFIKNLKPAYRKDMSELLGAHFHDYLLNIHGRIGMDSDQAPGLISKAASYYFRFQGQEFMTSAARNATAKTMSNYAAKFADAPWSKMGDDLLQFKANMERFGIDEKSWEHIRKGVVDFDDGSRGIVPEAIADRAAEQKWRLVLNDLAEMGSPEPTARTRALLLQGTQPGTLLGETLRVMTQFKAFPVFMFDVASRIHMSNPNRPINEMRELFSGRGDFKNLTGFMVGAATLAYAADSLIEASKGVTPKDPTDPKVIAEMFVRSGAAGMYGDLLIGESMKTKPDWLKSLAGPTAGVAVDVGTIATDFFKGHDVGLKAFDTAVGQIPYNNVFMLKSALDYTLLDNMRQGIDPKYEARKAKRLREQNREELFK